MKMPGRIVRAVAQPPIEPQTRALMKHREFIRLLPCVACGKPAPSECAPVAGGTEGRIGLQPNDRYTVPLALRLEGRLDRAALGRACSTQPMRAGK